MAQVPVARHGVSGIWWLSFMVRVTLPPAPGAAPFTALTYVLIAISSATVAAPEEAPQSGFGELSATVVPVRRSSGLDTTETSGRPKTS